MSFDAHITFLPVADLDATHAFYAGLLGLPLILDQGSCRIYRASRAGHLGFCRGEPLAATRGLILTLVDEDVDGWYERLATAGVAFEQVPAHNSRFDIYHCFFRDPDGHLLEIQRFDDPRWPG